MDDDDWMELADVARLLGRTERQVLRYAKDGKVATRRVGRRFQYRRDEVERLAGELEPVDATRHDSVTPDVGRALLEVLSVHRTLDEARQDVIAAQREIMQLRERVQVLEQQRQAFVKAMQDMRQIIIDLRKQAK